MKDPESSANARSSSVAAEPRVRRRAVLKSTALGGLPAVAGCDAKATAAKQKDARDSGDEKARGSRQARASRQARSSKGAEVSDSQSQRQATILKSFALGMHWPSVDPFLFCELT